MLRPGHQRSCEFCKEIKHPNSSRFGRIYRDFIKSRIVVDSQNYLAAPTIGQIFKGSLLILPKSHVETMAEAYTHWPNDLLSFLTITNEQVRYFGSPVLFEHGARKCTHGGCGIFHAHFHLWPLPFWVEFEEIASIPPDISGISIKDALSVSASYNEYILYGSLNLGFSIVNLTKDWPRDISSQFLRRKIVEHYGIAAPWDWRSYDIEQNLLDSVSHYLNHM